ncbi:MAG: hypothetical protein PVG07_09475 [Acidobacteriota bacterium]
MLARRASSDLTSDGVRTAPDDGATDRSVDATVLGVALVLRLLALPMAPVLSNDVYRYVWDGEAVLSGANPYRLAPEAPELAPLRARAGEIWDRMHHKDVPTVYPPLALGLFTLAAATPFPVAALGVLLTSADLVLCALLLALAREIGVPPRRTIWYAWSPLAVVETAGQHHVDALAVTAAVAAVLLVVRARRRAQPADGGRARGSSPAAIGAGAAAAAGALAKLGPVLALPMWARQSRRPWTLLAVAGLLLAAGFLPVAAAVGVPPGLLTYGVTWEFNGPLFEPLWRGLDAVAADDWVKGRLEDLKTLTGEHAFWNRFYPYAYPQLLAKVLLAPLLAGALLLSLVSRRPVAGTGKLFGRALLVSATVYPWYLLWVLPWAALARHRGWLLAAALSPLAYLPGLLEPLGAGSPELFPWFWAAVWGPPAVAALVSPRWRRWSTG